MSITKEPRKGHSTPMTEEVRRLLDERGVEHYDGPERTLWGKDASGYRFNADELTSGHMSLHMWCDTPEQAIEATLGRGECHDVYPQATYCFTCSECGHVRRFIQGWNNTTDSEQSEFRFCPNCGRKVVG